MPGWSMVMPPIISMAAVVDQTRSRFLDEVYVDDDGVEYKI